MRTRRALIALALALTACGSEPTALEDGGPQVVQSVEVVENDSLTVEAGATSDTVVAVLEDADGNPVDGGLSSWEVEGGDDTECGFWESGSVQSGSDGRVTNVLHAGEVAWTASAQPDCRYRVVDASEGAPEPLRDSVQVTVEPGPLNNLTVSRTVEDGTRDQFGDDGRALAQPREVWNDVHQNPYPYEAAVTSGPAHVVDDSTTLEWQRAIAADSLGTGTVELWTLPDSTRTLSGTFEVTAYGPEGEERWICVTFEDGRGEATCEGPPDL